MKKIEKLSIEELKSFEDEVNKVIQEVERSERKQKELENENLALKNKILQLQEIEQNFSFIQDENHRLKEENKAKREGEITEQDLVDIMISAKKAANSMIQDAQDEIQKINSEKKELFRSIKQEGDEIKQYLLNFKKEVDTEISQWVTNIEAMTNDPGRIE
jgi:predicted  nucleic acid-binding Zn-ribbon protein